MKKINLFISGLFFLGISYSYAQTGTWSKVKNLAPHMSYGGLSLLTDGRVICHNAHGGTYGTGWDILTPDSTGSYANGTWDTISSMSYDRLYFSSQVLPSGKLYVAGGEYGTGTNHAEVYDPATNTWATCGAIPAGWAISDGNSEILYNGKILEGPQSVPCCFSASDSILAWSPVTLNFTSVRGSLYHHNESSWLKLPDSSVLFIGQNTDFSNRYIPQTGKWVNDGAVPGNIYDGEESGGSFMLPNGKAIFFGATPYNAIYTPSGDTNPGTWLSADSFPVINGTRVGQVDASSAMMVNGHILLAVSPIGEFFNPCYFLEYDYISNTFTQVKAIIPGMSGDSLPVYCYQTNMLDLPDGTVLVSNYQSSFSNQYYIYTPCSGPIPQGKPTINNIIHVSCGFYKITGKLFNGISEGASYGDDWQMSTNWPLVRLSNGTNVYYAKSSNWNRIGAVQTGNLADTAYFTVPATLPGGTYSVVVVVNGFASSPTLLSVFGVSIASHTDVVCNGTNTGSATGIPSGGISPYTYLWSGGGTNSTKSGLSAGTYTLTVTDNNGCTGTAAATITQPPALRIIGDTMPTSLLSCTGAAWVTVTGGVSPYTYSWLGGQTTDSISHQCYGSYCCKVTDANGCIGNRCFTITISKSSGVDNISSNSGQIEIYPNPNNGKFVIVIASEAKQSLNTLEIYNVLGEKIYSQLIVHSSSFIVNLGNSPNGIYFYRVLKDDGSLIGEGKSIIEK